MESPVNIFTWYHFAAFCGLLIIYLIAARLKLLPSIQGFKDFADAFNSAGMHILLLSLFSAWSITIAMRYIYYVLTLPGDTLTKGQATIAVGMSLVTGGLTGTFIGALLKTMSGGKANGSGPAPPASTPNLDVTFVPGTDLGKTKS